MKESFVIFLCAFDPFDYGLRRYQFHQYEDSIRDLRLDTQSHVLFINAKGTKGEVSSDLAGIIDVMNQKPNQTNSLASKLMKEIDYYNQNPEKRRELMDYETRLLDERRLGFKEGYEEARREVRKEMAQNLIVELKAYDEEPSYIIKFVKKVFRDSITVEEMNELLKQV